MKAAILNPIRIYTGDGTPDYLTTFPNLDNVKQGLQLFFGVNASPSGIRQHIGEMYLQGAGSAQYEVWQVVDGVDTFVSVDDAVDISPDGWTGTAIYKITLDLPDGYYYLILDSVQMSDVFQITSSTSVTEDLIKIKYSNSVNDFGCIFDTNYFTAYFTGRLTAGDPKSESDVYDDDRISPVKLKSSPVRTATLTLFEVNHLYKDLIDMIFSCDTIEINGIAYVNDGNISFDAIEGCDLGNVKVKLVQEINDYYYG